MTDIAPANSDLKDHRKRRRKATAREVAYETAGPAKLARQPARASLNQRMPNQEWLALRQHMEARLNMLRAWRYSWALHWQLLENFILPRRGIFVNPSAPTPNTMTRGIPINQNIVDETGTIAMRRCAAGLMSGLMSPSRPWFKIKPALFPREIVDADAMRWFEETEDRLYTIMARSNFYNSGAQIFEDITVFGTGTQLIYEDINEIIRCYNPCCGEYFLGSSSSLRVEPFYRLFVMTISQIVEMFELENCPPDVQMMWQQKGGALEVERLVAHAIEPNFPIDSPGMGSIGKVEGDFAWREAYWLYGSASDWPLSVRGFIDQPFIAARWATTSNDPYGRSAGMDVLPSIMQLQVEVGRKLEGIEKQVRPPMLASMELKNEPASILPGKVTYVNSLSNEKGMRPIFNTNINLKDMQIDIGELQKRIERGFFNDLFMMLENAGNQQKTAYEIAERNQERLQVIGPVVELWQNEYGAPAIKRIARIAERKGLLPPLPKSLQNVPLGIDFVGILSLAQKAASTASLERFAGTMGNLQAGDPTVADVWSRDKWAAHYADDLYIPKDIMNDPKMIGQIRQARAKAQQQAQQTQQAMAAVQGAKTLSEIDVGGGTNAAALALGRAGGGAA